MPVRSFGSTTTGTRKGLDLRSKQPVLQAAWSVSRDFPTHHIREITITTIAAALLQRNSLGNAVIEVKEKGGQILLRGRVELELVSLAAEEIARQQAGEVPVVNQLRVSHL